MEGATLSGNSFQVVVDVRPFPEVGSERRDSDSMPAPRVDVFVDNENKGTIQEGQNVVTIDNVTPGPHKLVVLAKNQSGEVIDRKEVNFTAEAGTSIAQSSVETHRAPASTGVTESSAPAAPAPAPRMESAPPPPAPVRVGGNIKPPTKTKDVKPVYPPIAQSARVQGVVIIEAVIGQDGQVQEAKVLRSIPLLDAAALDAVKQWVFTPTLLNGQPVPVIMTVTVNFTLQ